MGQKSLFILLILLFVTGCTQSKTVQKTETIMGTDVSVTVVADSVEKGEAAINAALDEIKRLDRMMSLYKDDSEITRVNMAAGKHPVTVSPEMIEVAEKAVQISELTGGAFDVTIGPLVVLWQMRLKQDAIPSDAEIKNVLSRIGYRNLVIDAHKSTIYLSKPHMIMDFGAIAKGYAADKAAEVLKKKGIENGIVAVSGDIRVLGKRSDGKPWNIGVQHPRQPDKTLVVLPLSNKSISTSGDYERFRIVNNKRYHHILDPRIGRPSAGMESVTVIGNRGIDIDPLTTALFILGTEKGMDIVKKLGYEAIFVDERGDVVTTPGIQLSR